MPRMGPPSSPKPGPLSPAQRRLIERLQAGAQLRLEPSTGLYMLRGVHDASGTPTKVDTRTVEALLRSGLLSTAISGLCCLEDHGAWNIAEPAPTDNRSASEPPQEDGLDVVEHLPQEVASAAAITDAFPEALAMLRPSSAPLPLSASATAVDQDRKAVAQWLNEFRRKRNTLAAYAREARRFLLWLHTIDGGTLGSFDREALDRYVRFLGNPDPSWFAIGPDGWRPLKGPLSPSSTRQAIIILQGMYTYLLKARKVADNPISLMLDKGSPAPRAARPAPSAQAMARVSAWLPTWCAQATSERERQQRQRDALMWTWLYWTAARRFELASATFGQLRPDTIDGQTAWWWEVVGKGDKVERIPLDHQAIEVLLHHHGLTEDQLIWHTRSHSHESLWPRLRRGKGGAPLSDDTIYEAVLRVATAAASAAEQLELSAVDLQRIAQTTPHHLRAYRNTHMFGKDVPARYVQRLMRHADFETTLLYDHTDDHHFYRAIVGPSEPRLIASEKSDEEGHITRSRSTG